MRNKLELFCDHLIEVQDYKYAPFPELEPLVEAFDEVLVKYAGYGMEIICISSQKIEVESSLVREVGKKCVHYTGSVYFSKLPVQIQLIELTEDGSRTKSDDRHLKAYHKLPLKDKVAISGASVNLATGKVFSTLPFNGMLGRTPMLRKLVAKVNKGENPAANRKIRVKQLVQRPYLTYGMLLFFTAIMALEIVLSKNASPTGMVLIAIGALSKELVLEGGEWYRIFTAPLLHADLKHFIFNMIAFWLGGTAIERYLGRSWLISIFVLSATGGALGSLLINAENVISVGASGGIMGMLAAVLGMAARMRFGPEKIQIQHHAIFILIPSLLPLMDSIGEARVDYGAHFGGAIIGTMIGFAVYYRWSSERPQFGHLRLARVVAAVSVLALSVAAFRAYQEQPEYFEEIALIEQLIPQATLDQFEADSDQMNPVEQKRLIDQLYRDFPNDPRVHYMIGRLDAQKRQYRKAIDALETAIIKLEKVHRAFNKGFEKEIRLLLTRVNLETSDRDRARSAIYPLCNQLDVTDYHWVSQKQARELCI